MSCSVVVRDYDDLRLYRGGGEAVFVSGFDPAGPPSEIAGMFVRDDTDTTTADDSGITIIGYSGQRWKRVYDGVINLLWFIPEAHHADIYAGTSTFDCSTAMASAITAVSTNAVSTLRGGPRIHCPPGNYYFSSTISIKRTVIIEGDAMAIAGGFATRFTFAQNITGIQIDRADTSGNTVVASTTAGDSTGIRHIEVRATAGGTTGHGIRMRARGEVDNCGVTDFPENGIHIEATSGGAASIEGNANCWRVFNSRLVSNGGHGLYLNGADANAGYAFAVDVTNNGKSGIFDSSFLGNTFIGCHASGNGEKSLVSHGGNRYYCLSDTLGASTTPGTDPAVWAFIEVGGVNSTYPAWSSSGTYFIGHTYRTDSNSARSVFLGCYSESGTQPPSEIIAPSVVIGGFLEGAGTGFTDASNAFRMGANITNGMLSPFEIRTLLTNTSGLELTCEFMANIDEILRLNAEGDNSQGMQIGYWDNTNGTWDIRHHRTTVPIKFTTDLNTLTAGRSAALDDGYALFPRGIFFGQGNTSVRHINNDTSTPNSGEWARGDVVFTRSMSLGGVLGWVCTTAGTGGSTAVFGNFGMIRNSSTYSASNVTADRTFDANATTVDELADVLGTLISDLRTGGLLT